MASLNFWSELAFFVDVLVWTPHFFSMVMVMMLCPLGDMFALDRVLPLIGTVLAMVNNVFIHYGELADTPTAHCSIWSLAIIARFLCICSFVFYWHLKLVKVVNESRIFHFYFGLLYAAHGLMLSWSAGACSTTDIKVLAGWIPIAECLPYILWTLIGAHWFLVNLDFIFNPEMTILDLFRVNGEKPLIFTLLFNSVLGLLIYICTAGGWMSLTGSLKLFVFFWEQNLVWIDLLQNCVIRIQETNLKKEPIKLNSGKVQYK
jgi:hypothetical protein